MEIPPRFFEIAQAILKRSLGPGRDKHVQGVVIARNVLMPEGRMHLGVSLSDVHATDPGVTSALDTRQAIDELEPPLGN
jgi:hypothetical protein